ncbi:MAG TPA: DUF1579 family protein [Fimbriimonas sp.]|nr:DUF1579 family protein [Fimbriimonas sp.]
MKGRWVGKQEFNTGGAPMVGEATDNVAEAIGGRYLEEKLSTSLPGRKASDTRHFLTFDEKSGKYRAWWFNDTSVAPTELSGELKDGKLILMTEDNGKSPVLRATYEKVSDSQFKWTLAMKRGADWQELFHTVYMRGPER